MTDTTTPTSRGLLGTKLGMTQVWNEQGRLIPVTVIRITPNVVTQIRTPERDGYSAVQVTYGTRRASRVAKPTSRSAIYISATWRRSDAAQRW